MDAPPPGREATNETLLCPCRNKCGFDDDLFDAEGLFEHLQLYHKTVVVPKVSRGRVLVTDRWLVTDYVPLDGPSATGRILISSTHI